ncbi:MAG: KOW motif-containing protein [Bacteroidales bacterium]|nr:KOW motif-containing protein [Bacteroidales bacterium]
MYSLSSISWYAVKIYTEKTSIVRYLMSKDVEIFIPTSGGKPMLGPIVFLRCTEDTILKAKADWFSQIMVYRDPERQYPQTMPDQEMENFRRILNLKKQELHPLEVNDKKLLEGQKVRVLDGPLKGAVGVIKRIKGDRRLIVSISGIAAVATSYVSPEFLEKVD